MKIKILSYFTLLAALVSACGAPATPTIDAAAVQNTALASAFTAVAQTQAALPTFALATPTATPLPSDTPAPSRTVDPLPSTPTEVPTFTPPPAASNSEPCNKALLSWQGSSASFTIANETKPQGKIILLMSVATKYGECGWLHIYSDSFSGPVGSYSAGAFVDGQKNFKVFGTFQITEGAWKIIVRNDGIVAKGSCYPNC